MARSDYIEIRASHKRDLNGIPFKHGFELMSPHKTILYGPEIVLEIEPTTSEDEIEKALKQVLKPYYMFNVRGDEGMLRYLNILKMCDTLWIKDNLGNAQRAYGFEVDPTLVDKQGGFYSFACKFYGTPIVDKGCTASPDLLPISSFEVKGRLADNAAGYTDPLGNSITPGDIYFIADPATSSVKAEKMQKYNGNATAPFWDDVLEYQYVNSIISQWSSTNKWVWDGSIWHIVITIDTLTNPSGTNVFAQGTCLMNTQVRYRYKIDAGAWSSYAYISQGTYVADGITVDVGGSGTITFEVSSMTNSGVYMTVTDSIVVP